MAVPQTSQKYDIPYYVLLQQSSSSSASPANFVHPVIEYHFADDPPSVLVPSTESESIIIVDYPGENGVLEAHSLHSSFAVSGVRVADAPGSSGEGETRRDNKIYVIETAQGRSDSDASRELGDPQMMLAQFRERNSLLRKVLHHSDVLSSNFSSDPPPKATPLIPIQYNLH